MATSHDDLKKWMDDNRADFFRAYPQPNATRARRVWKNAAQFLSNAYEGDMIGGESGHADSEKTARDFLNQLKKMAV